MTSPLVPFSFTTQTRRLRLQLGGHGHWFFSHLGGIRLPATAAAAGWAGAVIKPCLTRQLRGFSASLVTWRGEIRSSWAWTSTVSSTSSPSSPSPTCESLSWMVTLLPQPFQWQYADPPGSGQVHPECQRASRDNRKCLVRRRPATWRLAPPGARVLGQRRVRCRLRRRAVCRTSRRADARGRARRRAGTGRWGTGCSRERRLLLPRWGRWRGRRVAGAGSGVGRSLILTDDREFS